MENVFIETGILIPKNPSLCFVFHANNLNYDNRMKYCKCKRDVSKIRTFKKDLKLQHFHV